MTDVSIQEKEAIFSALSSHTTKSEAPEKPNVNINEAIKNRSRQVAAFYGLESFDSKSQTPPLGGATQNTPNYSGYIYRYISGYLSDATFKNKLEMIMTSGLTDGKYSPIAEWQTFTKEGECVIALKYLEKVDSADLNKLNTAVEQENNASSKKCSECVLNKTTVSDEIFNIDVKGDK